jgi:dolichol-phosphate mannosyltransferase
MQTVSIYRSSNLKSNALSTAPEHGILWQYVSLKNPMAKTVIVIPTYNEAQNIAPIIARVREFEPTVGILVVDDNSPDGTAGIVESLMKNDPNLSILKRKGKEGLGKAYINSFFEVMKDPSVEWIQMLDADFSHDPKYLPSLFAKTDVADVVIGSRYVKGGGTVGWTLWRRVLSRFANAYCRLITGMPLNDTTAGFILMRTSLLKKANLETLNARGHAFMMELKHRLWKQGARIAEVPVLLEDRFQGKSKMSRGVILEAVGAPWKMRFKKTVSR